MNNEDNLSNIEETYGFHALCFGIDPEKHKAFQVKENEAFEGKEPEDPNIIHLKGQYQNEPKPNTKETDKKVKTAKKDTKSEKEDR